jgi:hypothetical protein
MVTDVTKAAAILIEDELHAFVQPSTCNIPAIREYIQTRLPYYARPIHYHALENFPLTSNGKVDKKALKQLVEDVTDCGSTSHSSDDLAVSPVTHASSTGSSEIDGDEKNDVTWEHVPEVQCQDTGRGLSDEMRSRLNEALPDKKLRKPFRGLRHRIFIPYRFIFSTVWMANVGALIAFYIKGVNREWLSNMVAINLTIAVLIRQDVVINILYSIFCSIPKSWPIWIRARCGKIYHLGGAHSSAASCAGLWLLAANVHDVACVSLTTCHGYPNPSPASMVLSWILVCMFISMIGFAWPSFRKANHNFFELWHRFVGWTMLVLFWAQTMVAVSDTSRETSAAFGKTLVYTIPFWLLLVASSSVAFSWIWLRRVSVISEVLSDHAIQLHFDYTVPVNGSFTRVSFRPLIEWHSFATIPRPQAQESKHLAMQLRPGYSLVVSNAGDWTKYCIQKAPQRVWVRGLPTCGVMRIATLFNRVVVVATGSGIGPCLGHIMLPSCATQLIWSTRDPARNFGPFMVDAITKSIPDAIIWDTDKLGRPDMVKLSYNLAKDFQAEAVIVIANEKITKKIVYGLETRGIPAYGAIWDS